MKKIVVQAIARNIETKSSNHNVSTLNILHQVLAIVDNGILSTSHGTSDSMSTSGLNRLGDEVALKGVSIKFVMELPVYMSDVTYRVMLIKSAKGDFPNTTTLFAGLSSCKLIDPKNVLQLCIQRLLRSPLAMLPWAIVPRVLFCKLKAPADPLLASPSTFHLTALLILLVPQQELSRYGFQARSLDAMFPFPCVYYCSTYYM